MPAGSSNWKRADLDTAAEGIGPVGVTGQRPHTVASLEEELREVQAAVAEGSGDRMDVATHVFLPY